MKQVLKYGVLAILAVILIGCIETTILIRLNRDGSGTIEETVIISKAFTQLIAGFSGETEESAEEPDLLDEEELREEASNMGEGVVLVSAEKLSSDKGSGYRAIFSFEDINTIRVNQNPGENLPGPPGGMGTGEQDTKKEYIKFQFKKGPTAILEIINPLEAPEPGADEKGDASGMVEEDPAMQDMMRQLYQDMKIGIAVEVEGQIVETNATYRDGSTVTIMELDFGKLLEDEETFKELVAAQPETLEGIKGIIKDNEGIKVELQDRITIRFK